MKDRMKPSPPGTRIVHEDIRFRALVETAVDGVIVIDSAGSILMFNPACERLFGYQSAEVIGANVKMLMPAPFRAEHDGYLHNYRTSGVRKIIGIGREVMGQRKDGCDLPDGSVRRRSEGGRARVSSSASSTILTERKRTEEQLVQAQKMETVGQLSGGIAHDFNNLLTVILGNAETLADTLKARPDLKRSADAIFTAGERGAELTHRLLAFSRRQTLQPVEIDCNASSSIVERLLQRTLREDIEIRTHLDDGRGRPSPIRRSSNRRCSTSQSTPRTPCPTAAHWHSHRQSAPGRALSRPASGGRAGQLRA